MDGILTVMKPSGMTSHDMVSAIRRITKIRRIGHSGTLDPLAAGVLPIYIGKATRVIEYGDEGAKVYHSQFILGCATDTEDGTGAVIETKETFSVTKEALDEALQSLTGVLRQRPSNYSAIKINGQKAYDLARAKVDFTLPEREIEIYSNTLIAFDGRCGVIRTVCSKGTYIRALLRDLGEHLQVPITMTFLVRTASGSFTLDKAYTLEELESSWEDKLLPMDTGLSHMERWEGTAKDWKILTMGQPLSYQGGTADTLALYIDGRFVGIGTYQKGKGILRPHKMIYITG